MPARHTRAEALTIDRAYSLALRTAAQIHHEAEQWLTNALTYELRHTSCVTSAKATLVTTFATATLTAADEPLATLADLSPGARLAALAGALVHASGLEVPDVLRAAAASDEAHAAAQDRRLMAAGCFKVVRLYG